MKSAREFPSAASPLSGRSRGPSILTDHIRTNDTSLMSFELNKAASVVRKRHTNDMSVMFDQEIGKILNDVGKTTTEQLNVEVAVPYEFSRMRRRTYIPFSAEDFDFDADLISLTTETDESFVQSELETSDKFLDNFGVCPTFVDQQQQSSPNAASNQRPRIKDGNFVDPLTGEVLGSDDYEGIDYDDEFDAALEESADGIESEDKDDKVSLSDQFSLGEIDKLYAVFESKTEIIAKRDSEQHFILWEKAAHEEKQPSQPDETDIKVLIDPQIDAEVSKFFDDMIKAIVRRNEEQENLRILKTKLDKKMLFKECLDILEELHKEKKVLQFLDRKASEHFRRKGSFRQIYEDKPDDYERYVGVRQHLNELLGAEKAIAYKTQKKIEEVTAKLNAGELDLKWELQSFEAFVRSVLKKEDMPHLEREIDLSLRRMAQLRLEISKVRSVVIQQQHTLGRLNEKIKRLQDLGGGLQMSDFEALLRQVTDLDKKVEDRLNDLSKLHYNFQNNVHALSHMKNKSKMINRQIHVERTYFNIVADELLMCRKRTHGLNKQHNRITKKLKDCRVRVGLRDKPVLLRDYDATVERIAEKRNVVKNLRKTLTDMQSKIRSLVHKPATLPVDKKNVAKSFEPAFIIKGVKMAF